jgi:phosphomannomutase
MADIVNPAIFRAYDIRGVVDVDLDEPVYERLGQAAATYLRRQGARSMVVARDARLSSLRFQKACIAGALAGGIDVIDIGEGPTPLMYFAVDHLHAGGGAVISASHNPPEYNGLKLRRFNQQYGSEPVPPEAIRELARLANHGPLDSGQGRLSRQDVQDAYVRHVTELLPLRRHMRADRRPPRVVLDGGNGVAGPLARRTLEALGLEVVPLFIEPDGRFPNHHPDPLKAENLTALATAVREHGADLGIGLDGDGDRLGVVDAAGEIVWADRYLIVLAHHALSRRKGPVVFDVKCSTVLADAITELGGTPVMWRTGYPNLSARMRELDAVVGAELSGHAMFPYAGHYFDDGAFAGAHLIYSLLSCWEPVDAAPMAALATVLAPYPVLPFLTEGRISYPETEKFRLIEYLRQRFAAQYPVVAVDGVRVDFGDGWGLVRASNTEPAITTRFEAGTDTRLYAIRDIMLEAVEDFRLPGHAH